MFCLKLVFVAVLVGTISARHLNKSIDSTGVSTSQGLICAKIKTNKVEYFCGATLIAKHILLTLAECIQDSGYFYEGTAGNPNYVGPIEYLTPAAVRTFYYKYDQSNGYINNVGLLIFGDDLTMQGYYQIAHLPKADEKLEAGTILNVNGHNIISNLIDYNNTEALTTMKIVERNSETDECINRYDSDQVNDQTLCAILENPTDTCAADHGGPIYHATHDDKNNEDIFTVVAIAIRTIEETCKEDKPLLGISLFEKELNYWLWHFYDVIEF